jgi:hypothetical protein
MLRRRARFGGQSPTGGSDVTALSRRRPADDDPRHLRRLLCAFRLPVYRVAKATHDLAGEAALAWIPILSTVMMCRIARVSAWSMLVLLLGVIPVLGGLIALGYSVFLWVKIGQRFDRTGLAVLAGLLPVIGAWVFAYKITPETA